MAMLEEGRFASPASRSSSLEDVVQISWIRWKGERSTSQQARTPRPVERHSFQLLRAHRILVETNTLNPPSMRNLTVSHHAPSTGPETVAGLVWTTGQGVIFDNGGDSHKRLSDGMMATTTRSVQLARGVLKGI